MVSCVGKKRTSLHFEITENVTNEGIKNSTSRHNNSSKESLVRVEEGVCDEWASSFFPLGALRKMPKTPPGV
jgi:hypothetical protein